MDFFELLGDKDNYNRFDVISLCLVLNFVPEKEKRGEMLKGEPLASDNCASVQPR